MGRKQNDGRGRLGGRAKGTPNKKNPLKQLLRTHSIDYFTPSDVDGLSAFDRDTLNLKPSERVNSELALLRFHTPQMQATSVDMTVSDDNQTFAQRLAQLGREND